MCEVDRQYLEHLFGITLVHFELLDGHGASQVFTVAHVGESTVVTNTSDVCDLVLKDI